MIEKVKMIIERVDSEEKINKFLPHWDERAPEGLRMTLEKAPVIMPPGVNLEHAA